MHGTKGGAQKGGTGSECPDRNSSRIYSAIHIKMVVEKILLPFEQSNQLTQVVDRARHGQVARELLHLAAEGRLGRLEVCLALLLGRAHAALVLLHVREHAFELLFSPEKKTKKQRDSSYL